MADGVRIHGERPYPSVYLLGASNGPRAHGRLQWAEDSYTGTGRFGTHPKTISARKRLQFDQDYTGRPSDDAQPYGEAGRSCKIGLLYDNVIVPTCEVFVDVSSYWLLRAYRATIPTIFKKHMLRHAMNEAQSYAEWVEAALDLDRLEGKQHWKMEFESDLYDNALIDRRLDDIRRARASGDVHNLMFLLRAGLFRNLGNMGNPALYTHCNVGTKRLIERYNEEVVRQLEYIASVNSTEDTLAETIDFFRDVRLAFGRTALMLSGGASLGVYHLGVIKVLFEQNLLPRIITGSSAGAVLGSIICCKQDSELRELFESSDLKIETFTERDGGHPWMRKLRRLWEEGVLADNEQLKEGVRAYIKDVTFQEAYNATRRILNVTVTSTNPHEGPRLLNYLTAPHVVVWSAVCASCSFVGLFKPVELMAKTKEGDIVPWGVSGEQWVDGSMEADLPIARLSELFDVNNFLVSQVNPHVLPFMHPNSPVAMAADWFPRTTEFVLAEWRHRVKMASYMFPPLRRLDSIWSQKYSGNITIVPPVELRDYLSLIDQLTPEHVARGARIGERATWPKVNMIRMHCEIELTLDRIFYSLQERVFDQRNNQLAQQDYVANPALIAKAAKRHASIR